MADAWYIYIYMCACKYTYLSTLQASLVVPHQMSLQIGRVSSHTYTIKWLKEPNAIITNHHKMVTSVPTHVPTCPSVEQYMNKNMKPVQQNTVWKSNEQTSTFSPFLPPECHLTNIQQWVISYSACNRKQSTKRKTSSLPALSPGSSECRKSNYPTRS